jgi:hypothetical protein
MEETPIGLKLIRDSPTPVAKLQKLSSQYLSETHRMITSYRGYDETLKGDIHWRVARILRWWITSHGIPNGDRLVRSNKAGIACSGEIMLHTDPITKLGWVRGIYLQVCPDQCNTVGLGIMYRTVRNTSDYTGGMNRWIPSERFFTYDGLDALFHTVDTLCKVSNQ